MRVIGPAVLTLLLAACATAEKPAPAAPPPEATLDADPANLQIEIGRYSALLGQIVEHTGVSYEHAGRDHAGEGAALLMMQLRDAVDDYNGVRAALCATKGQPGPYASIRAASCATVLRPAWRDESVTYMVVAQRSHAAGEAIIGLWDQVCTVAARQRPAGDDTPVCPME
jgi:hypothetical protein